MTNRVRRRVGALAGALALVGLMGAASAKTMVYVSNATDGDIDAYAMNSADGVLTPAGKTAVAKAVMPMAVSPDRKHLYAVVRSEPMRVVTFAIDPSSGALEKAAEAPLPDSMPYVTTDRTGRFLLTSSYSGSKVAVSPIDPDGAVRRPAIQVVPTGLYAHSVQVDRTNRFAYAANLGSDQLVQFRFDPATGALSANEPAEVKVRSGDGPRHMVFSPDDRFLYVLHEMSGTVVQFAIDPRNGTLRQVDSVESTPPEDGMVRGVVQAPAGPTNPPVTWAADIQMTPDGRFIYTTERSTSRLIEFAVAPETGKLSRTGAVPTVTQPRGIRIDSRGRYLVASGEKSDAVAVYRIDAKTGGLAEIGRYPGGKGANWVEIVDLP